MIIAGIPRWSKNFGRDAKDVSFKIPTRLEKNPTPIKRNRSKIWFKAIK